jgi:hypothetical protein
LSDISFAMSAAKRVVECAVSLLVFLPAPAPNWNAFERSGSWMVPGGLGCHAIPRRILLACSELGGVFVSELMVTFVSAALVFVSARLVVFISAQGVVCTAARLGVFVCV